MKYPVKYKFKIGEGKYFSNTDPDYNQVWEDILKFFKDNAIQHRFVDQYNRRGYPKDHPNYVMFKICNETLYFYREQDRNFFLLNFGDLYESATV